MQHFSPSSLLTLGPFWILWGVEQHPWPHPLQDRSTLSVKTTDAPRCRPVSPGWQKCPPEKPCFMASLTSLQQVKVLQQRRELRLREEQGLAGAHSTWGGASPQPQAPSLHMTLGPRGKGWVVHIPGHTRVPGTGRRNPGHATVATSKGGMPGQCHHLGPVHTPRKETATQNWAPGQVVGLQAWGWPLDKG